MSEIDGGCARGVVETGVLCVDGIRQIEDRISVVWRKLSCSFGSAAVQLALDVESRGGDRNSILWVLVGGGRGR